MISALAALDIVITAILLKSFDNYYHWQLTRNQEIRFLYQMYGGFPSVVRMKHAHLCNWCIEKT